MAYLLKVLTLVLALCASPAFAGYAQLRPPTGWSQGMGAAVPGQAGVFKFGPAANSSKLVGDTVLSNASLSVGGQLITMPVSMRIAANSVIDAAGFSFGNPWIFATLAIGSAAYQYFNNAGLRVENGVWVKPQTGLDTSDGFEYLVYGSVWSPTRTQACRIRADVSGGSANNITFAVNGDTCMLLYKGNRDSEQQIQKRTSACPSGWYLTPAGCVQNPQSQPVSLPEFQQALPPGPAPAIPGIEYPVEVPVINPSPSSPNSPRPLWVPAGDPYKNPNPLPDYENDPNATPRPDTWTQPGVRIIPSPTPDNPWRVDLRPEPITKTDPSPTSIDPQSNEKSPEPTPGLCEQFPDILACQKLGEIQPQDLQTKTVPLAITPDSGWNMAPASCPAPKVVTLSGKPYSFEITPLCDFATAIKPLVVGFAWLSALLGFIGLSRKGD